MSVSTKLILACIGLGCVICICNLASFAELVFQLFLLYLAAYFVIPIFRKNDTHRGAPLTAAKQNQ